MWTSYRLRLQRIMVKLTRLSIVIALLFLILLGCQPQREQPAPSSQTSSATIKLPQPAKKGEMSLEETLLKRRSKRSFSSKDLTIEQISQLLWAAQGITDERSGFRTAPSAGALYPLELYLVTREAAYHYESQLHQLRRIYEGDLRSQLCAAALDQPAVREASIDIVITAVYQRTEAKYGERGSRYVHLEAGHAAQNILLQAVALRLGAVPIGAFYDDRVQNTLVIPPDHKPLYIIAVGYQKDESS